MGVGVEVVVVCSIHYKAWYSKGGGSDAKSSCFGSLGTELEVLNIIQIKLCPWQKLLIGLRGSLTKGVVVKTESDRVTVFWVKGFWELAAWLTGWMEEWGMLVGRGGGGGLWLAHGARSLLKVLVVQTSCSSRFTNNGTFSSWSSPSWPQPWWWLRGIGKAPWPIYKW